ncbi:MAG: hypothetical protein AB7D92_04005 [Sphaerochaeta sp.]
MRVRTCLLFFMVLLTIFLPLSADQLSAAVQGSEEGMVPEGPSNPTIGGTTTENVEGSVTFGVSSESDGLLEGMASSDGSFSISYKPDFSIGPLTVQLNLLIQGKASMDPFNLDFDFSPWQVPSRDEEEALDEYLIKVTKHYGSFIRSIEWGQRYEPLYIRYGKLMGITLGDGALLNGYFDYSVGYRESRPGLDVMLDGTLLGIPNAGFEFVTNNLYEPTLSAWRIYARPLWEYTNLKRLQKLEVGLSHASSPNQSEAHPDLGREMIALDFSLPLLERENITLDLFSDLLLQLPDEQDKRFGSALRYGLGGHTRSYLVFNTSLTVPTFGNYYTNYYASDFETRSNEETEALRLPLGSYHIDGMLGLNFTHQGFYMSTHMESNYTEGDFHDYGFIASARIDKPFMHIVSLDLQYEKLYPTSTGEGFFEGIKTLKNVVLSTTTVIKVKPYSFDIGLSVHFDEVAEPTYTLDTLVRISIL